MTWFLASMSLFVIALVTAVGAGAVDGTMTGLGKWTREQADVYKSRAIKFITVTAMLAAACLIVSIVMTLARVMA